MSRDGVHEAYDAEVRLHLLRRHVRQILSRRDSLQAHLITADELAALSDEERRAIAALAEQVAS